MDQEQLRNLGADKIGRHLISKSLPSAYNSWNEMYNNIPEGDNNYYDIIKFQTFGDRQFITAYYHVGYIIEKSMEELRGANLTMDESFSIVDIIHRYLHEIRITPKVIPDKNIELAAAKFLDTIQLLNSGKEKSGMLNNDINRAKTQL